MVILDEHNYNEATKCVDEWNWERAKNHLDAILIRNPDSHPALHVLAHYYLWSDEPERGIKTIDKAIKLCNHPVYHIHKANHLLHMNRIDECIAEHLKCIEMNGDSQYHYHAINSIKPDESYIEKCDDSMIGNYTLGKIYEHLKDYEKAEHHYIRANEISNKDNRSTQMIDVNNQVLQECKSMLKDYRCDTSIESDYTPIFIVGTMRSGSTLTEKILDSHLMMRGIGEVPYAIQAIKHSDDVGEVGKFYESRARYFGNPIYTIDKQLFNAFSINHIRRMFPSSKIIWTDRNKDDVKLSIFTNPFANEVGKIASCPQLINRYVNDIDEMMTFWKERCGDSLYHLKYETLVGDFENEVGKLMDFIGLPVEKQQYAFHKNKRPTKTTSHAQVKRGLYSSSVGKIDRFPRIKQLLSL